MSSSHQPPLRREGRAKLTGAARYIDDLSFQGQGLLHGVTVRSQLPRARIKSVEFLPGVPWDEITVVTAKDIPGKNAVALILYDQPFLADQVVNHPEEPIVLLAHPDRVVAEQARKLVKVELEPLTPVLTLSDAIAGKEIIWGQDNLFKKYKVEKGDVDAAFAAPGLTVVEGVYETGAQEQLYIEPNGMVASYSEAEGVTIWGSMQCPYYVHKGLLPLFGLPEEKIRIIQAETGGGFGGKEEYPTLLAGHAALLARKSGKPVKMIYDRAEDMVATTKRHPSRTKTRMGVDSKGVIQALEIEFLLDGGAYCTLSPVVLSRGTIHAAGPYAIPNVRIHSRAYATNTPPHGAFRGFGAPQSLFAMERHMDVVAAKIGLTPDEFRRRNFVKKGLSTATSQTVREDVDLNGIMEKAMQLTDFTQKRLRFAQDNAKPGQRLKKGIGLATFHHGAGFTGSGEKFLASKVGAEALADGTVRVLSASTEIGQGTNTIFSMVGSQALGLPLHRVEVAQPDTRFVPNSGPTVASRTAMVVGKLVESACIGLKQTLVGAGVLKEPYTEKEWNAACAAYISRQGALKVFSQYQQPPFIQWDDETYRGDAYGTFAWACYVAEVTVDLTTYETRVDDFVAIQEIGKVLHPVLAAGQIEGGVAQGIGYAITEKCIWKDGRMINGTMTNYIMPTAADLPPIRVYFEENPYAYGPSGAKGIGELPMDGPGPAIMNAVAFATGAKANFIPMLPEDLMRQL